MCCEGQQTDRRENQLSLSLSLSPGHTGLIGTDCLCVQSFLAKCFYNSLSSNCRFFTYGNFPLEQHLKQIHEEALCKFQKIDPNTAVPPQLLWDQPVSISLFLHLRMKFLPCVSAKDIQGSSPKNMQALLYFGDDQQDTFKLGCTGVILELTFVHIWGGKKIILFQEVM